MPCFSPIGVVKKSDGSVEFYPGENPGVKFDTYVRCLKCRGCRNEKTLQDEKTQ